MEGDITHFALPRPCRGDGGGLRSPEVAALVVVSVAILNDRLLRHSTTTQVSIIDHTRANQHAPLAPFLGRLLVLVVIGDDVVQELEQLPELLKLPKLVLTEVLQLPLVLLP